MDEQGQGPEMLLGESSAKREDGSWYARDTFRHSFHYPEFSLGGGSLARLGRL